MPKTAMDYSKTIIYKLVCNDLKVTELYVGHTTNWRQRKSHHRQSVENINHQSYNCKKSTFIRERGGFDNWTMVEIEKYPCSDEQEARARERYWYETLCAGLNSRCPFISKEEYTTYQKEYKEENKDKIQKYNKEYYEENKDKIQKYSKEYNEQNKDKIQARITTKYVCDCGAIIRQDCKSRHLKSLKHCEFLKTNNI